MTTKRRQHNSTLPMREKPLRSSGRVRPRNGKRRAREIPRTCGPDDFRDWLHRQACMTCGVWGFTVQAHAKNGGMSRKADWTLTLPLCCSHDGVEGCHEESHRGQKSFEAKYGVTLLELAARTQERWQQYLSAHATGARAISQGEE